jgi:DNA invertase Pin-like site-specific DNA recombinase
MDRSTSHPLRAAIYARFSSELQRDASLDDQLRICEARARAEGWTIVATFSDAAISGATTLRPGYQALLSAMREGTVDLVLAESLDRFSRDLEHVAALHKLARFSGVRIVTLAEGEVSELAVGLKGTMGALYLKDLADKTRRGEEGRIRLGRAVGKPSYGYRMVRRLGADGEPERGLREIDPIEAAVVRRIFRDYATGQSPLRIARALNQEGVPAPGGRRWYATTIRGTPRFGGGILRNPIYRGRLVWNRSTSVRDPLTGQSVRRPNPEATIISTEVPTLRIVDEQTWQAAQARLAAETVGPAPAAERFCDRRPRHLLSGKVVCGTCGGPFYSKGKDYLACHNARHRACTNQRPVRRPRLGGGCPGRARPPDHGARSGRGLRQRVPRRMGAAGRRAEHRLETRQRELLAVERQLDNLIDAIADGLRAPGRQARLDALEAKRGALMAAIEAN